MCISKVDNVKKLCNVNITKLMEEMQRIELVNIKKKVNNFLSILTQNVFSLFHCIHHFQFLDCSGKQRETGSVGARRA